MAGRVKKKSLLTCVEFLLLLWHLTRGGVQAENVLGVENEDFDFDGLPGAQHEFKVDILASREECFFQTVAEGASLHVSFEVLKGTDRRIDFYVRDETWATLELQTFTTDGTYTLKNARKGTYAVCIDNAFQRMGKKLVYVSIVTYVMFEWIQFQKDMMDIGVVAENLSLTLQSVQTSFNGMRVHQSRSRFTTIKDWYMIMGVSNYILKWSLGQMAVIVAVAITQVYTLRRLFRTTSVTPNLKPRA